MRGIKALQVRLTEGYITRKYYNFQLRELRDSNTITEDEWQAAMDFDTNDAAAERQAAHKEEALVMLGIKPAPDYRKAGRKIGRAHV